MIGPGLPGFTYDHATVSSSSPTQSGVYAIYNAREYIYVGEGQDIRARLLAHLRGDNACITRNLPSGFAFELVAAHQRVPRQDALILQLHPLCNQKLG